MNTIEKLETAFAEFPGVGLRQARRFVYYLLTRGPAALAAFSSLILKLKQDIRRCESCFRFFVKETSHSGECSLCRDKTRDRKTLLVISRDVDLETVEKSGSYRGLYFVLGGSVPVLEKKPASRILGKELAAAIEKHFKTGELQEIILALNANPEGENTEVYVRKIISPLAEAFNLKISTLGRGLSTGTELEYSDPATIKNAIRNRQ